MAENEKKPLIKKRDMLIVAAVLLVAAAGMVAVKFLAPTLSPDQTEHTARILVGGNYVYKEVSLSEDQVIEVDQGNGIVNHVVVKDGTINMQDSTCPDQQCIHQGEISPENYEERILRNWIICLPNQVTIELVLEDEG